MARDACGGRGAGRERGASARASSERRPTCQNEFISIVCFVLRPRRVLNVKMEFPNCRICKCALNFDVVTIGLKGQNKRWLKRVKGVGMKILCQFLMKMYNYIAVAEVYTNERSIKSAEIKKTDAKSCSNGSYIWLPKTFDYQTSV